MTADPAARSLAAARGPRFDASPWRAADRGGAGARRAARERRGTRWASRSGPAAETCGGCAWLYVGGRGRAGGALPAERARAIGDGARTEPEHRACARWEPPVDCQTCGACCREAYHSVTVSVRDPVVWKEPDLIVRDGHRFEIRRERDRVRGARGQAAPGATPALRAARSTSNRPHACREFAAGGRHCLEARRRVGLSAGRRSAGLAHDGRDDRSLRSARRVSRRRSAPPVERALGWRRGSVGELRVVRRSLDARKGRPLGQRLRVLVVARRGRRWRRAPPPGASGRAGPRAARRPASSSSARDRPGPGRRCASPRPGCPATVLEQGKPVQPRRRDLALITRGDARPRARTTASARGARGRTPTASSTRAPRIARASRRSSPTWSASARPPRSRSTRARTSARTGCRAC